jgi:hypothetical protein
MLLSIIIRDQSIESLLKIYGALIRDMLESTQFALLRYTKYYHKMQAQELVMDLFNDANFKLKV